MEEKPSYNGEREKAERSRLNRRGFLKAASGSVGGVALSSGVASARHSDTGLVSELTDCLDTLGSAPEDFAHITEQGEKAGDFPEGPDELAIFINGFASSEITVSPIDQAYMVSQVAENSGYGEPVVGFTWGSLSLWVTAKKKAMSMGEVLAGFVDDYKAEHTNTDIHIVGHSLGARVVGSTLQNTDNVSTASVLGAAIPAGSVSEGGEFHDALSSVDEYHSYYSDNDSVLGTAYELREFGTDALGYQGAEGNTPSNYAEHDVSDIVESHCDHTQTDGSVTRVVPDVWGTSNDESSGSDESGNDGGSDDDGGGFFDWF